MPKSTPGGGRKWIFDPTNDDRIIYPRPKLDPKVSRYTVLDGRGASGNPPAKSQWSIPRGCPDCGGHLRLFNFDRQYNLVVLQCWECWRVWHEPDLNNDEIYRLIPESERMAAMNKRNRSREIEGG